MVRLLAALVLLPAIAFGQTADGPTAAEVFGSGKPVQFHSSELDHRFGRTQIPHALDGGPQDPPCAQPVPAVPAMAASAAPTCPTRDETSPADPPFVRALQTQLSIRGFPAN